MSLRGENCETGKVAMRIHQVLARFAQLTLPVGRETVPSLECLGLACVQIAGARGGSLTVEYGGAERMTLFASDRVAARLEDLEEVLGEGPGWDAWRTGEAVSQRLRSPSRWPLLASVLPDTGDGWVGAAVIHAGGEPVGVLSLYWQLPDDESGSPEATADGSGVMSRDVDDDVLLLTLLADLVGIMFALTDPEEWEDQLPWSQRDAINRAIGVLVAQMQGSVADAVALLRSHAFTQEITLLDAAHEVLDGRVNLTHLSNEGQP